MTRSSGISSPGIGYGDGALVDLCRGLELSDFARDTILYEIFDDSLEQAESVLRKELTGKQGCNLFDYFKSLDGNLLQPCHDRLAARLRKDTEAALYVGGREQKDRPIEEIFGQTSSRLNRSFDLPPVAGRGFHTEVRSLPISLRCISLHNDHVVCRHGPDTRALLKRVISDYESISPRLDAIEKKQAQTPSRLWSARSFSGT